LSEWRDGGRQNLQLANGLEPLDRENDSRGQRLGGQETARKARIFAVGRRGMPFVPSRLIVGIGAVTMLRMGRGVVARQLVVTAMPRSRMIVQRMDRRRGQQITGKRQGNENPL
jgi:hypothetical protein